MPPLFGVAIDFLLIDVLQALVALVVGVFSALWYVRYKTELTADTDASTASKETQTNNEERTSMAAVQLRDLVKNVASDVGDHSTLVSNLSEELGALDHASPDSSAAVVQALTKILAANNKLQGRLADAEQKIQTQAEEIREQHSEARTDALTMLANRRAFDDELEKNITGFHQNQRPFSLLIFDVDHFKKFNDTHGHQAGDEVLRSVGKTMKQVVQSSDTSCRYGGEEFALVMPSTSIDQARAVAERVRKAIEEMDVPFEGKTLHVTASMGVAEVASGEDASKLIRRSDEAVYVAKKAGRNCGYWHNEQECLPLDVHRKEPASKEKTPRSKSANSFDTIPSSNANMEGSLQDLPDCSVFLDELKRRISESHRFGAALTVMHICVKDYKSLTSEYGEAVGRLLLDSVAQFVRGTLRDMDLLGKLELGEFVVMLPGSSEAESLLVGKRMQMAISNCVIPLGDRQLKLELLLSVTSVQPNDDAQSMMNRAKQIVEQPEQTLA